MSTPATCRNQPHQQLKVNATARDRDTLASASNGLNIRIDLLRERNESSSDLASVSSCDDFSVFTGSEFSELSELAPATSLYFIDNTVSVDRDRSMVQPDK